MPQMYISRIVAIWCIGMIVARSCGLVLCVFILRHHFMMQHDDTRPYVSRTCRRSWKHPSSCMDSILIRHVSHWAWLGCSCTSTLVITKIHWTVLPVTSLPPKLPVKKLYHQSWYATPVTGRWIMSDTIILILAFDTFLLKIWEYLERPFMCTDKVLKNKKHHISYWCSSSYTSNSCVLHY